MTQVTESARTGVLTALANAALAIAGASLIAMAGVEAWQVFARYVLNDSPSWTEPVALLLMSTTMMLGAAVGVRREAHFGFFILVESSSAPLRKALLLFARTIVAGIGALLAILGASLAADSWSFQMAGVALPQGATFVPIAFGGALIAVFAVERMVTPPAPTNESK